MPDRPSPFRLNLEQQRKRAKDLLKGLKAGDADALRRFRLHHPKASASSPPARLSEAQLVVARELGLPSWPRLVSHIAATERSLARIRHGGPAPDEGMSTLHIRCGSDIREGLREAGFVGGFLEYSDPFCQGPVVDAPDWLERRADFLVQAYGSGSGMSREDVVAKLRGEEEGLLAASANHERIVLWFEHDTYDQLILARCLARFAGATTARLELISPARYPGGTRFIGLGQLPPEALRLLWEERVPVPTQALQVGKAAWEALRDADPRRLAGIGASGTPALPQLGRAIRRHCQELPWIGDGLALSERLVLQLLAERPRHVGEIFRDLMMEIEPLPWMTDLMIKDLVDRMRQVEQPVFTGRFEGEDRRWPDERLTITELGRAVLAGRVDWLELRPPMRWVGGVPISGVASCWRWDEAASSVARR